MIMIHFKTAFIAFLALPLLGACAAHDDTTKTQDENCGAENYQALVGTNIAAITLSADLYHRIIGPDTIVTKDYRIDRINFYTDENGIITQIACG